MIVNANLKYLMHPLCIFASHRYLRPSSIFLNVRCIIFTSINLNKLLHFSSHLQGLLFLNVQCIIFTKKNFHCSFARVSTSKLAANPATHLSFHIQKQSVSNNAIFI